MNLSARSDKCSFAETKSSAYCSSTQSTSPVEPPRQGFHPFGDPFERKRDAGHGDGYDGYKRKVGRETPERNPRPRYKSFGVGKNPQDGTALSAEEMADLARSSLLAGERNNARQEVETEETGGLDENNIDDYINDLLSREEL